MKKRVFLVLFSACMLGSRAEGFELLTKAVGWSAENLGTFIESPSAYLKDIGRNLQDKSRSAQSDIGLLCVMPVALCAWGIFLHVHTYGYMRARLLKKYTKNEVQEYLDGKDAAFFQDKNCETVIAYRQELEALYVNPHATVEQRVIIARLLDVIDILLEKKSYYEIFKATYLYRRFKVS